MSLTETAMWHKRTVLRFLQEMVQGPKEFVQLIRVQEKNSFYAAGRAKAAA